MTNNSGPMLLTLMPQRNLSWSSFAISFGVQSVAVTLLMAMGILCPQQLIPQKHYAVVQLIGMPLIHHDPAPLAKRIAPPSIQHQAEARLIPATIPVPSPALSEVIARSKPERAELPAMASAPKPRIVNTGAFSSGSSAPATVSLPARKVQTGGFGDPNSIPGEGKAGANLIARAGSFDLPLGRGQGSGTGGTNGARGTVASAGFGNGVAPGNGKDQGGNGRGAIQQSGFGDGRPAEPRIVRAAAFVAASTAVEILSKPKPVYTEEARQLRLEGEVIVAVTFAASGEVHVLRVIRALGHGLDEAAIRAAQQIRFLPAKRDGQPVDSTAALHVVFQLAY